MTSARPEAGTGAQTAGRALELLSRILTSEEPLGLADLVRETQLNKSTAYRLLRELQDHGFITRAPDGRKYMPGARMISLAAIIMRRMSVRVAARPIMQRIAEMTQETVSLHIRYLFDRICIEVVDGRLPVRRTVPVGETLPLWAGPSGKVILAFLPESDLRELLEQAVAAEQSITQISAQLSDVQRQGYLAVVSDRIEGVGAVSVPVFDSNTVIASLTVSGPGQRWGLSTITEMAPDIVGYVFELSRQLGHLPPTLR